MINDYNNFSVIVNGGSGCLFPVFATDYMYVLTAKHLFKNNGVSIRRQYLDENQQPKEVPLNIIGGPYFHSDANKDAALVKVEVIPRIDAIARVDDAFQLDGELILAGYPNSRSAKPYAYRQDRLTVKNTVAHGFIECQLSVSSAYNEIVGLSGGGIYYQSNGQVYLAGIQSEMAENDDNERLSNINIMPLAFFDEIIEQNTGLAHLQPEHLVCFSTVKAYAMKLEGCYVPQSMEFTKRYLQGITDDIVQNSLTPTFIRNFFKSKLLIAAQSERVLGSRGLWIAWLEFLIILNFIKDEQINDQNIERVFDEVRLIYSDTEGHWTGELGNIFRSDFYGMPRDAKVIVATQGAPPEKCVIADNIIPNIIETQHVTRKEMKIDIGLAHPLTSFKLMHIHAFQRLGIINNEQHYYGFSALNEDQLIAKLKKEFNAIIA
jgi:hypothetical protein